MPPRNVKRAPPPKNRGKTNGSTRTSNTARRHHRSRRSNGGNRNRVSARLTNAKTRNLGAAPIRPPSNCPSKFSSGLQPSPTHASADDSCYTINSVAASGVGFTRNTAAAAAATTATERSDGDSTNESHGFTYLSPKVLTAARSAATISSLSSLQEQTQQPLVLPSSPPSTLPSSLAESSLARLRALASGAPSLVLTPHLPAMYGNEESPLQQKEYQQHQRRSSSEAPSTPPTPYTPDLVRRLAELNGTPYKQAIAVLHTDRLKRSRNAAAAANTAAAGGGAATSQPTSPDQLSAFCRNEEDEESTRCVANPQTSSLQCNALSTTAASNATTLSFNEGYKAPVSSTDLVNEEEDEGRRRINSIPLTQLVRPQSTTSRLDRLRAAAGRAASNFMMAFPLTNLLAAPSPSQSPAHSPAIASAAVTTMTAEAPQTSPVSAASAALDVTSRLALLRQRMIDPSAAPALQSTTNTLSSYPTPPSSTLAVTAAPTVAAAHSLFMNLERVRVGDGSTPVALRNDTNARTTHPGPAYGVKYLSKELLKTDPSSSSQQSNVDNAYPSSSGSGYIAQTSMYTPLSGLAPSTIATPPPSVVPPRPIDAIAHEDEVKELHRLESHLQRYRDNSHVVAAESPKPKRAVRRPQRRRSTALIKKESAVATLVKGRRSGRLLSGEESFSNGAAFTGLSSAQVVAHLRSLAAPVPVGEGGRSDLSTSAVASATPSLPPSWSSSSPFAALASPNLYDKLNSAARDHQVESRDEKSSASTTPQTPLPVYNYPSVPSPLQSSSLTLPSNPRRLPAVSSCRTPCGSNNNNANSSVDSSSMPPSSQCFVFDTSSLLDAEPGVLNLLLERAYIGIPFKVLDELDNMHKGIYSEKDNSISGSVVSGTHDREWRRKRAHDLRNWITSCVGAKNSHLHLQKRTEVVEAYDRQTRNNDDQILGYAVYLRQNREKVVFVTEDKFLRIKAAAEIGRAYSYTDVRQFVGMPAATSSSAVKRIHVRCVRGRK